MKEIRLPPGAVQLATWATAGGGQEQLVVIEQRREAAAITVATPLRIARLSATRAAGQADAGPLAIPAGELARAASAVVPAPGQADAGPLVVMQLSPELGAVLGPSGSPSTVAIVVATLPDATGVIDATEGEAASGMTKSVAVVPPDYLRQVAELAESIGCTAVEIVFAPRFGSMLAAAEAPGCTATIVISTDGRELLDRSAEAPATSKPLVFTVKAPGPRSSSKPAKPEPPPWEDDLPF
jgi:hypothetical protein